MKKTITVLEINALVIAEATKLKKNATLYEIANLDFSNLRTASKYNCIYGQMTGNCFSERAVELIEASCKRVFNINISERDKDKKMGKIYGKLNGKPVTRDEYWSPIEIFIDMERNQNNGNNKRLIDYLKGETKKLTLK